MCGIFGYVGKKDNASQLVLDGIKLLEYRGYDSWGVAAKTTNKATSDIELKVEKYTGKIIDNEDKYKLKDFKSNLAIGHTRWATHGGVTVPNAHPHVDCTKQIAVIHNGIVENFSEIKNELLKKGHKFHSETDTEIIPHLIEEYLKNEGFASAARDAFNRLSGLNAIVVMYLPSLEIIAAKTGSPLVLGENKDGLFVASDASGIIKHTKKLVFLKDQQMAILGKTIQVISLPHGKKVKVEFEEVNWEVEDVNKGTYEHFMIKEIHEQAKVIRNISETYTSQVNVLAESIKKARGTFIIGAGTAYNAGLVGTYLFSKIANTHINMAVASEFNYLEDFLTPESLIIALTQSGETIDVVEPLQRAQKKGSTVSAIVNVLGSTIYRMADHKILLGAGPEKAVASTKAYTAKLAILLMLAFALKKKQKTASIALEAAALEIHRLLQRKSMKQIEEIAELLLKTDNIYIVGRGVSYPSALEAALKVKEVSYIHTEGLAGGELKHGTIALITEGTPCIVFAPNDETFEAMISNAIEIKARGGVLIGISPFKHDIFDHWIEVKDTGDASVISQIVPAQILAYYLALKKGLDPDKPRNLAKSVTVK